MEMQILKKLEKITKAIGLDSPYDARDILPKNSLAPDWKRRSVKDLQGMVWHQALSWASVENVARYHIGPDSHLREGGVRSISYTFAIRRTGQIVLCNSFKDATWSQGDKTKPGDENQKFMAVMFEGWFKYQGCTSSEAKDPNDNQILAGMILWQVCKDAWNWNEQGLFGHYLFGKESCPGQLLQTVIEGIRHGAKIWNFSQIKDRQQILKETGYYKDGIDGVWGALSTQSLRDFQSAHGLNPDGIWGPKTEAVIKQYTN